VEAMAAQGPASRALAASQAAVRAGRVAASRRARRLCTSTGLARCGAKSVVKLACPCMGQQKPRAQLGQRRPSAFRWQVHTVRCVTPIIAIARGWMNIPLPRPRGESPIARSLRAWGCSPIARPTAYKRAALGTSVSVVAGQNAKVGQMLRG